MREVSTISKVDIGKEKIIITGQKINLGYEKNRWPYLFALPIMWALTIWVMLKKKLFNLFGAKPKINTFWFDGLSLPCRAIKEGAGSWKALDIIYNFDFGQKDGMPVRASDFWIGMLNAQAVRNRLKLVKHELTEAVEEIARKEEEVRILSLASGSAQGVIEVVAALRHLNLKVTLVDLDPKAIAYSQELARKYGVENQFTFSLGNLLNLERAANGQKPHIIEMIGFLDYRPNEKAVYLIKRIYDFLLPGGKFFTGNICPNPEQHFLKWVIDWPMIYRKPKELRELLVKAKFSPENIRIEREPLKIHTMAVCQKLSNP